MGSARVRRREARAVARAPARPHAYAPLNSAAVGVMTVVQTAMLAKLPHSILRDAILTHPTMAEGLGSLLANVPLMST
ncbi:MAG: hypothetical protein E6J71_26590 [Deltaproteobacteria bacterium]|nr:MAG: hypothetical protein E6J71_26590 [Deltaproteobacteria bacterium]